jgi:Protein of unknown function (DUF2635)
MKVVPAEGLIVRDPESHAALPPEGREVPDNDLYWLRRIRDGDVTMGEPDPPPDPGDEQTAKES